MPVEDIAFSAGGGFLFGAVAGHAIKKVIKIAVIVIGLFICGLVYLSYKGWINVKWIEMESAAKTALTNVTGQVIHTLNSTSSHFPMHSSIIAESGLPLSAALAFVLGLIIGFQRG